MKYWGMPGPGGSLGKCAVCGKPFLVEILMGQPVQSFKIKGIAEMLYAHQKCADLLKKIMDSDAKDWRELPGGPLRTAFEEQEKTGPMAEEGEGESK